MWNNMHFAFGESVMQKKMKKQYNTLNMAF